jgi:hypothetical protein
MNKYRAYAGRAGLAAWGEGDFWVNVHFFDPKTGLFEEVPTAPLTPEEVQERSTWQ